MPWESRASSRLIPENMLRFFTELVQGCCQGITMEQNLVFHDQVRAIKK